VDFVITRVLHWDQGCGSWSLSRINVADSTPIIDTFPDEHLLQIQVRKIPWYAHIVNYLVSEIVPSEYNFNARKKFLR